MNPTRPIPLDQKGTAGVLTDPDTSGFVVFMVLLGTLGKDLFQEDGFPDAVLLYADLHDHYGIWIPEELETKLQTILLVAENPDAFQDDVGAFMHVVTGLWDGDIDDVIDGIWDDPDIQEISWGLIETGLLADEDPDFSGPVRQLIESALRDGIENPTDVADEISERAARILQDLQTCGFPGDIVETVRRRLIKAGALGQPDQLSNPSSMNLEPEL